jgi:putative iron-regulated protein
MQIVINYISIDADHPIPLINGVIMSSALAKLTVFTGLLVSMSSLAVATTITTTITTTTTTTKQAVLEHYADIGHAVFEDSLISAQALQQSIKAFTKKPSKATQLAAQKAWLAARIPYQQSEVFRFGNAIVDDWEGQLNAWPLDEGLIDYVDNHYEGEMGNVGANLNIIANPTINLGDTTIDSQHITAKLLASLNELGGSEANVATGYHAIEFLLWGQDLNGTAPGAGDRPFTDYAQGSLCSNGHCDRRATYLNAVTQLLVNDLKSMVKQWQPGLDNNYRTQLLSQQTTQGLTKMLMGMGSLSLGELAGERMKVALEANSTEDEHDCFSDNTHNANYYDALGIQNIYLGQYQRIDGTVIKGASLSQLVSQTDKSLDQQTQSALSETDKRMMVIVNTAQHATKPMKFDQLIAEGNKYGEKIIGDAIQALVTQTEHLEKVAKLVGIKNLHAEMPEH